MDEQRQHNMGRVRQVHFVGIGGAGMSGIAEVLHNLGYKVSGSDLQSTKVTRRLQKLGVDIVKGHQAGNVSGSDVVVFSSAVEKDNPELSAARKARIPVIPRAEMLAELMRFQKGIAIAGTHGKTTTTSLVASLLAEGKLDPTYVIGGLLKSAGSHARLGTGEYMVAEADESDTSFLHLQPIIVVLTSIDADHLVAYRGDFACLQDNFLQFLHLLPFYGLAIICLDDRGIEPIIKRIAKPFLTYGIDREADYYAHNIKQKGCRMQFQVSRPDCQNWLQIILNLPGRHNVLNALAAIVVAHELAVTDKAIVKALSQFEGIARRCEVLGKLNIDGKNVLLIDDYAHHPSEIAATFDAVKEGWTGKRLVVVFEPHRYTRTRDLFEDFCSILCQADILLLLDVYRAGEKSIAGADSRSLCRGIRQRGRVDPIFVKQGKELHSVLRNLVEEDDVLLMLGAGDVGALSSNLYQRFGEAVR